MISAKMKSNYYPSVVTERRSCPSFLAWSSSVLLPHTTGRTLQLPLVVDKYTAKLITEVPAALCCTVQSVQSFRLWFPFWTRLLEILEQEMQNSHLLHLAIKQRQLPPNEALIRVRNPTFTSDAVACMMVLGAVRFSWGFRRHFLKTRIAHTCFINEVRDTCKMVPVVFCVMIAAPQTSSPTVY